MTYTIAKPDEDVVIADPVAGAYTGFGYAVAIDGDIMVVGNPGDISHNYFGVVSIFEKVGGVWTETYQEICASNTTRFGYAVAIDAGTVVVGETHWNGTRTGQGRVHIYTKVAGSWTLQQTIVAVTPQDSGLFGCAVAIDGDRLVVGAKGIYGAYYKGRAFAYTRSAGVWSGVELVNLEGYATNNSFGHAVAIEGTRIVVSAPQQSDTGAAFGGKAAVYDFDGVNWAKTQDLVDPTPVAYQYFGDSVAVRGDRVFVSCTTAKLIFVFELSGGTWSVVSQFSHSYLDTAWEFGRFISASPDGSELLVTCSTMEVVSKTFSGAVILFSADPDWASAQTSIVYHAYPPVASAYFGKSADYDGTSIVVGCWATARTVRIFDLGSSSADTTPPAVSVSPAAGTPITATDIVTITVTDAGTLQRIVLLAKYAQYQPEVIWDGFAFQRPFMSSVQSAVGGGVQLEVQRTGGWKAGPTIQVIAIDAAGNEA